MMGQNIIHPTAIIEEGAVLGAGVRIGPYCHVGPKVVLGDGVQLVSHVVVTGRTTVGPLTQIFPFACVGSQPQDLKFNGEDSALVIGSKTIIREYVTINPGTEHGGMITQVGDQCLLMATCHVAHDCILGNNVIMANGAVLGGHVTVGNRGIIGGLAAIHQFVRIGESAMVSGATGVVKDILPYTMVRGTPSKLMGLNLIGLKRKGLGNAEIFASQKAFKILTDDRLDFQVRSQHLSEEQKKLPVIEAILSFIQSPSDRGFCISLEKDGKNA